MERKKPQNLQLAAREDQAEMFVDEQVPRTHTLVQARDMNIQYQQSLTLATQSTSQNLLRIGPKAMNLGQDAALYRLSCAPENTSLVGQGGVEMSQYATTQERERKISETNFNGDNQEEFKMSAAEYDQYLQPKTAQFSRQPSPQRDTTKKGGIFASEISQIQVQPGNSFSEAYLTRSSAHQTESEHPRDVMLARWTKIIEKDLPANDLIDLSAEKDDYCPQKRQFSAEYAQIAYRSMLKHEFIIGDYVDFRKGLGPLQVSEVARRHMVTLLEDLNRLKSYSEEQLYLATSLCDRYLVNLAVKDIKAPCLVKLAVVCTLISAKLEQPLHPSFNRMICLIKVEWNFNVTRLDLVQLEQSVFKMLDFDLQYTGPIPFLERYQRIFSLDLLEIDLGAQALDQVARGFCRSMLRSKCYLSIKPSQIGAVALTLAINLNRSNLAPTVGLPRYQDLNSLFYETLASAKKTKKTTDQPLKLWNKVVRRTTGLIVATDLRHAYSKICAIVNKDDLNGLLGNCPDLFPL